MVLKNEGASTLRYLSLRCGVSPSAAIEQVKRCAKKVRVLRHVIYYVSHKLNTHDPFIATLLANVRYIINLASNNDVVPLDKLYANIQYPKEMVRLLYKFIDNGVLNLKPFRNKSDIETLTMLIFGTADETETNKSVEQTSTASDTTSMDKLLSGLLPTLCNTNEDELKKYGLRGYLMLSVLKSILCTKTETEEKTSDILDYLSKYGASTVQHLAHTFNISEDDVVARAVGAYYRDVGGITVISPTPDITALNQSDSVIQDLLRMVCYLKDNYSARKITHNELIEIGRRYLPYLNSSSLASLAYDIYRNMTDRDRHGHRKFRAIEDCTKALVDFLNTYQPKKIDRIPYIVFSVGGKIGELVYDGDAKVKIYGDKESGAVTRVEIHLNTV